MVVKVDIIDVMGDDNLVVDLVVKCLGDIGVNYGFK